VPNVVLQRAKVLSPFHPGLWFVSGGGSAALEEARYGRWAAAEGGGGGRGIQNQRRGRSSLRCCTESWKLIGVANSKIQTVHPYFVLCKRL